MKFQSVDEYIASFPASTRKQLSQLREIIQAACPNAEEVISYGMGPKAAQLIMNEMRRNQITFKKKQ